MVVSEAVSFASDDVFCYSFDFCRASDETSPVENLGQVVFGERIRPSPYKVLTKYKRCESLWEPVPVGLD
jgi:hypothetical protein